MLIERGERPQNRPVIRDFSQLPFCGRKQPRISHARTIGTMGCGDPIVASNPND